jgi:hypothetical protein
MERVRWDELEADVLREKIIAVHNIVFGQLGTIAFTMHEMGLPQKLVCLPLPAHLSFLLFSDLPSQVERFVMSRAHGAQLGRDQQVDLLKSIRYTPDPLPPLSLSCSFFSSYLLILFPERRIYETPPRQRSLQQQPIATRSLGTAPSVPQLSKATTTSLTTSRSTPVADTADTAS